LVWADEFALWIAKIDSVIFFRDPCDITFLSSNEVVQ
jgi:hypothetical protein